jgi:hypothetical protein
MSVVMCPMGRPGNDASYVTETNFRDFVAFGLMKSWLGSGPDSPNEDVNMVRPITTEDVTDLRGYFLNLLETVIVCLWRGDLTPGSGYTEEDPECLIVGDDDEDDGDDYTIIEWGCRLDKDAIMLELTATGCDPEAIWLSYDAIADRQNVVKVLTEARQFVSDKDVWDKLVEESKK